MNHYLPISRSKNGISKWLDGTKGKNILILVHILLGMTITKHDSITQYWGLFIIVVGTYQIIKTRNKSGLAHLFCVYIMSLEVFLRMTKSHLFWEFGKYSSIYFLVIGLLHQKTFKKRSGLFLFYFYALIPAIFLTDAAIANHPWRQLVSENLSGPASLVISSIYFYRRPFSYSDFSKLCYFMLLPLITTVFYLFKNLTLLSNINFTVDSNFQLSAGFGPNQISTALGFGICIIFSIKLLRTRVLPYSILEWGISAMFLIFAFLTFSRGGVVSSLVTCIFGLILFQFGHRKKKIFYQIFFTSIIIIGVIYQISISLNTFTQGFLEKRYSIQSENKKKDLFTGRGTLLKLEKEIFFDHWLFGVGVGMNPITRRQYGMTKKVASHTEYSRLLSEHGIFGLISLFIMLYIPLTFFPKIKTTQSRIIFVIFMSYSLITIAHSAMRLALPGIIYGIAFISLYKKDSHEL